jgi:hypothetical protein
MPNDSLCRYVVSSIQYQQLILSLSIYRPRASTKATGTISSLPIACGGDIYVSSAQIYTLRSAFEKVKLNSTRDSISLTVYKFIHQLIIRYREFQQHITVL